MNELTETTDRICPHCGSSRTESMGMRDNTGTVRRFRCKNCLRSHSRDVKTGHLTSEVKEMKVETYNVDNTLANRANKTLNVTNLTKIRLESIKVHQRETVDELLNRLIDNYVATKPQ